MINKEKERNLISLTNNQNWSIIIIMMIILFQFAFQKEKKRNNKISNQKFQRNRSSLNKFG